MKKIFSLFFILCCSISYSQIEIPKLTVDASLNNLLRYGNGYEYTGLNKTSKEYFENLTDGRININNIILGFRYEISDPIEYGRNFKGIRKRFAEYNHDIGISIRAGDYWDIVSRGMTMNIFEDRTLGYDTGIDGIRASFKHNFGKFKLKTQFLGGDMEYSDYLNPTRIETYKVRDANVEISPWKNFTLGTNYVFAKGKVPNSLDTTNIKAELPEVYLGFSFKDFNFYSSYAHKNVMSEPNNSPNYRGFSSQGDGLYSSLSYSKSGLGITLDYKNYRFDLTGPDNRGTDRPTKLLPFQNPPTAQKEHTSTLISRNPHVTNFNDEVGGQLDIIYVASEKFYMNLNLGVASEHYKYADVDSTAVINYQRVARDNNFIPNITDDAFNPFWEYFVEAEYYATEKLYTKLAFSRQSNVVYNQINPNSSEKILTSTIPLEVRYEMRDGYALKFNFEQQWEYNSIRTGEKNFMNEYVSVNLTKSPSLGLTVSGEFTNDKEEPTGKSSWFLGEIIYKLNQKNQVTFSYGSERGGLKCTNGICRYVNPFEGFRFALQTSF
jgi:hypothetical protein